MDFAFGPNEWASVLIVGVDESGDVVDQVGDAAERGATERLTAKDREPDLV